MSDHRRLLGSVDLSCRNKDDPNDSNNNDELKEENDETVVNFDNISPRIDQAGQQGAGQLGHQPQPNQDGLNGQNDQQRQQPGLADRVTGIEAPIAAILQLLQANPAGGPVQPAPQQPGPGPVCTVLTKIVCLKVSLFLKVRLEKVHSFRSSLG